VTRSVCLVLTRPLWNGSEDALIGPLQEIGLVPGLRVLSAPLQLLSPGSDQAISDQLMTLLSPDPAEKPAGVNSSSMSHCGGLVVATSPSSVEALARLPQTAHQLQLLISQTVCPWAVTGVGQASAQALAQWLGLQERTGPRSFIPPADFGSGVQVFLQWFDQTRPVQNRGDPVLLLEAATNQPTLARAVAERGFIAHRLGLYSRQSQPMPKINLGSSEALCVLVSSSALVSAAVEGLQAQGIDPKGVYWLTHHSVIADSLTTAVGMPVPPLLDGLSEQQILSGLARLNLAL